MKASFLNPTGLAPKRLNISITGLKYLFHKGYGNHVHLVWEDPHSHELLYMKNGEQGETCETCPKLPSVGDKCRDHDAEQHFVQYLEESKQHENARRIEDIWIRFSPCATCSNTLIEYYKKHEDRYGRWRPKIHFAHIYKQLEPQFQQLHRQGLKNLLSAGFHLEVIDPKLFVEKYHQQLKEHWQEFVRENFIVDAKSVACLYAVKHNCYHLKCRGFGSDYLPECIYLKDL